MKEKGYVHKLMFSHEGKMFCQKVEGKPWSTKVLPKGKGFTMKYKGFAKKEKFNHEVRRFCQEVEISP